MGRGYGHAGPAPSVGEETAEYQKPFRLDVKPDVGERNLEIIERMLGQLGRIISEGDHRKTSAVQGLLDALDPGEGRK